MGIADTLVRLARGHSVLGTTGVVHLISLRGFPYRSPIAAGGRAGSVCSTDHDRPGNIGFSTWKRGVRPNDILDFSSPPKTEARGIIRAQLGRILVSVAPHEPAE